MNLLKVYELRVASLDFSTTDKIEELLKNDYRNFYFVIIYLFLSDTDLSNYNLIDNTAVCMGIRLLLEKVKLEGVREYYSKYFNVDEYTTQLDKINFEISSN